jgi:hypothetical protein
VTDSELSYDASEFVNAPSGVVNVRHPQARKKGKSITENAQWQIAVEIVVAVKEPTFLVSVHGVIGSVNVQNDLCRCIGMSVEKHLNQQLIHGRRSRRPDYEIVSERSGEPVTPSAALPGMPQDLSSP